MLISSDVWVAALIRRAEIAGAFATVVRKGDARAGAVLVKSLDRRSGAARLYAEAIRAEGDRIWMQPLHGASEVDLDAYVERAVRIDPDLWVVEVEDADASRFLTEPVEKP